MTVTQGKDQTGSQAALQDPTAPSLGSAVPRASQSLTPELGMVSNGQHGRSSDPAATLKAVDVGHANVTPPYTETNNVADAPLNNLASPALESNDTVVQVDEGDDPLLLRPLKRENINSKALKEAYPTGNARQLKKFYVAQNELIDDFLNSSDEERLQAIDEAENGPKVKFAVNASFAVNFCLFIIQLYAAISTGSLSLFATAADAFMDLVSSFVMFLTSRMAARPSIYKYPVGRARIETLGIIMFCALMTTVAVQLIIESARRLGEGHHSSEPLQVIPIAFVATAIFSKFCLFCYCYHYRRYPAAHVFFIDHRNDLVVNAFGLAMSIIGNRVVWYLDPIGAICIGLLILFSWVSNAFEQIWLLVGKAAPPSFVSKVIYMCVTHSPLIRSVDTCRAYHSGQKYYVEVDVIMDEGTVLRESHDVSQELQRKLEGLADVERAFVHVDYEAEHDVGTEHKPLYGEVRERRTLKQVVQASREKMVGWVRRP